MKSQISSITFFTSVLFATLMMHALPAHSADVDSNNHSGWLPVQFLFGPHIGVTASKFITSPDYEALIKPAPAQADMDISSSFGAMVSARWKHGITLTLAPRREVYGLKTQEQTVSFPGNPFPHTLKSNTELSYTIWPLLLGMGWYSQVQHFQVQIGVFRAALDRGDVAWTVDSEPYDNRPYVEYRSTHSGRLLGLEYGHQLGGGEVFMGLDTKREPQSLMSGLRGSITAESMHMHLGYAWSVKTSGR